MFIYELKKLWNWRILLIIAAFGVLTWFALLAEGLRSYDSLTKHGAYGSYQTEMFRLYGETLEPDELEDFDIPGKLTEIYAVGDAIIVGEPVFAKYGISSFEDYLEWQGSESYWIMYDDTITSATDKEDVYYMNMALNGYDPETLEGWYASPLVKWQNLNAVKERYTNMQMWLDMYIENDERPVVVRTAERINEAGNNSLINEYLMPGFSVYAAVTGVFALVTITLLVIPMLITDRSRMIHYLQYSSSAGRKILRIQFAATVVSTFILSAVLTAASFTPFIVLAGEYWNTSIMSLGLPHMWLYDVTFGQYVFILAGMIVACCVGAACVAFTLVRFSSNVVSVMIKAVPVVTALSAICALTVTMALSYNNAVFNQIFKGRFDVPEVIVCGVIGVIGAVAASVVTAREKRVDVM